MDRYTLGTEFEGQVIERLRRSCWCAVPFGQGMLPPDCRQALTHYESGARLPSLLRWLPDIIAYRNHGRPFVAVIDVKVCHPNRAIETSALEVMELMVNQFFTPAFFVFDDWLALTPREVRQRARPGLVPDPDQGSGTPYVLVDKQHGHPFDDFFPPCR